MTGGGGSNSCAVGMNCEFHPDGGGYVGLNTSKGYDNIRAMISNTGTGTIELHELCVN